jgi:hypothetical protein
MASINKPAYPPQSQGAASECRIIDVSDIPEQELKAMAAYILALEKKRKTDNRR